MTWFLSASVSTKLVVCPSVPEGAGAVDAAFYLARVCVVFKAGGIPTMKW